MQIIFKAVRLGENTKGVSTARGEVPAQSVQQEERREARKRQV